MQGAQAFTASARMYAEGRFQQPFMHKLSFLESLQQQQQQQKFKKFIMMHLDHFMNTFIQQEQKENCALFLQQAALGGTQI